MADLLFFKRMVTPIIIQVGFWVFSGLIALAGFVLMIVGLVDEFSLAIIFLGVVTIVLGPLIVRIYCELLIVVFSINEHLREIRNATVDSDRRADSSQTMDTPAI